MIYIFATKYKTLHAIYFLYEVRQICINLYIFVLKHKKWWVAEINIVIFNSILVPEHKNLHLSVYEVHQICFNLYTFVSMLKNAKLQKSPYKYCDCHFGPWIWKFTYYLFPSQSSSNLLQFTYFLSGPSVLKTYISSHISLCVLSQQKLLL